MRRSELQASAMSVATVSVVMPGRRPPMTATLSLASLDTIPFTVTGIEGAPSLVPTSFAFNLEMWIATMSWSRWESFMSLAASMYCRAIDPPPTTMATLCPFLMVFGYDACVRLDNGSFRRRAEH